MYDTSVLEKQLLEVGEEILGKSEHHDLAAALFALSFLINLHKQLAAESRGHEPKRYHKYAELASDLASYLAKQIDKDIYLEQLGRRYGLNPRYLNRIFKAATGYPIFQYQQLLRIELAKKLLWTSSLRVLRHGNRARQQPLFQYTIPENDRHDSYRLPESTNERS